MDYRTLGRTGVAGQPALPRRDDVRRLGQPRPRRVASGSSTARSTRASTSSTPPTSTRAASPRRSSARRSPAAGATTSCSRRRSTARWATTRTSSATRAAGSSARSRTSLRRLQTDWIDLYQIHRPEPDTDIDETLGALTDLVRAGQGPLHRLLDVPGVADRRGAVGRARPRPRALRLRAAAVLDARPRRSRPTCCRPAARYGMGVIPWSPLAGGWLSGKWRKGAGRAGRRRARERMLPQRYDLSIPAQPAQARRRRRARAARRGGGHDADPARARVRHPPPGGDRGDHRPAHDGAARVASSAPPTSTLDADVLDRIDEIVPPGTNVNPADARLAEPGARAGGAAALSAAGRAGIRPLMAGPGDRRGSRARRAGTLPR